MSKEHTSLKEWKALNTVCEEDERFKDGDVETTVSTSTALSLDDNPCPAH